jgi:hypothetical protein
MGTAVKDDYVADTDLLKNPERGMYYLKPLEDDDDDYDTSWIVAEWLSNSTTSKVAGSSLVPLAPVW